jgi:hypothetical protein
LFSIIQGSKQGYIFVTTASRPVMDSDYKNGQIFSGDIFNPPSADKIKWEND